MQFNSTSLHFKTKLHVFDSFELLIWESSSFCLKRKKIQINLFWLISKRRPNAAVGDSDPYVEKPLEIANVLWTQLHLTSVWGCWQWVSLNRMAFCGNLFSGVTDICQRLWMYYEGETEFDSSDISLNHIVGYAAVLPPEAIKEVSLLIHPLCNKLTAHTVNMLPDPPCLLWLTYCLLCSCIFWATLAREAKCFSQLCLVNFRHSESTVAAIYWLLHLLHKIGFPNKQNIEMSHVKWGQIQSVFLNLFNLFSSP